MAGLFAGPPEAAAPALAPLAELGAPLADLGGTSTYVESQSALDDLFPDGGRYYWKSHFLDRMSDAAIAAMLECDARRPNPESVILIRTLGGAVRRVGEGESSFAHRSAAFNLSVDAIWSDPALDEAAIGWARSTWGALAPHATGGVYLNFAGLGEREDDVMSAAIGASEARLARIRRAYDPEDVFEAAAARP